LPGGANTPAIAVEIAIQTTPLPLRGKYAVGPWPDFVAMSNIVGQDAWSIGQERKEQFEAIRKVFSVFSGFHVAVW
jgi:hypothetical protein